MKFLIQLEYCTIPEWSEFYLDFKKLQAYLAQFKPKKEAIPDILDNPINEPEEVEDAILIDNPFDGIEKLKELYKEESQKINTFLNSKYEEIKKSFTSIEKKMIEAYNSKKNKREFTNASKERDEIGYAVSWKRALSQLYNSITWLYSYYSINTLGKEKILRKAIKRFKGKAAELTSMIESINKDYSFDSSLVEQLRITIRNFYAQLFFMSNNKKAVVELESRLTRSKTKHSTLISFYGGIVLAATIFYILLEMTPIVSGKTNNSLMPFFPAFNFTFILIELILGLGLNIIVLRKYRINYIYIFEVDPKLRLGHYEMFQNGMTLLSSWMIFLLITKLSLGFDLFNGQFFIFVLLSLSFIIIFFLFPFHCSYFEFRKGIIVTLFRNLFPLGKNSVRFRDFVFGDILTSINKPFASLVLSFCLLNCDECKENNTRNTCSRNTLVCFIVLVAPFIIRFFQCLNRLYYTGELWPHLGNAFKYTGGIMNVGFSWLYALDASFKPHHIIVGCVASSYMLFWDIYMDWNLGRPGRNFFLRDKLVYPKAFYYSVIVINACLRFTWLTNFLTLTINPEMHNFILAILEAYRRIQWSMLRIENENTNNPEKYRSILEIPEMPYE